MHKYLDKHIDKKRAYIEKQIRIWKKGQHQYCIIINDMSTVSNLTFVKKTNKKNKVQISL